MKKNNYIQNFHPKTVNTSLARKHRDAEIVTETYRVFMIFAIMTLRDEFDFGTSRLNRFLERMSDLLDSHEKGYISIEDMEKTIFEEVGIEVRKNEINHE